MSCLPLDELKPISLQIETLKDRLLEEVPRSYILFVRADAQSIYWNLKVYDILLRLLFRLEEYCVWKDLKSIFYCDEKPTETEKINCHNHEYFQFPIFSNIFTILYGMTVKNKRMKILLWKYKTDIILPDLGPDPGYGELELLNELLDDQSLLSKATDLQDVLNCLIQRKSDANLPIMFEILSKITTVTSNAFVEDLILTTFPRYSNTSDEDDITSSDRHFWII